MKALVKKNNDAMSEWQFTIEDMLFDGDKTAVRWSATGIHTGSLMGEEPTGNRINFRGTCIYHIQNKKIITDWHVADNLGLLTQIGVLPTADVDMTK